MTLESSRLWTLMLGLACVRAEGGRDAELPRPGVPEQELAVLERNYSWNAPRCTRTAEEVVDMQRRCSEARWADCAYAATMYVGGCGVARDLGQAEALYQRACAFGSMFGCVMQGVMTKDLDRSIALLETPCARGDAYACESLGIQLFHRGKAADVGRATDLIETSCRKNRLHSCSVLGEAVAQWKLEQRFAVTRELLGHACEAQNAESCYTLAKALENGTLGAADHDRAANLHAAACERQSHLPSCNALGHMLVLGRGCEKNPLLGVRYFSDACRRGHAPSCDSMGQAIENGWGAPSNPSDALQYYDYGCELGSQEACEHAKASRAAGTTSVKPPED